ncbi:MAG TPA: hypothetical protein VJH70_00115 [Candidatus Paceibacterota bacterium]
MDKELSDRLAAMEQKVDYVYRSVEKTRKYFLWTLIISLAVIVLPIIGLVFAIPQFMKTINYSNLGL